ncbi:hypothetical protein KOW79_018870 [Hemibagrus wyckioides]|uniref:Uncharacterized protein n=1 Tax=Hemibagrus wyckioides TaxID=337641 RepID=A0A9D3NB42_9TELE|nr:hypothetical protein KOW79_018870 [Hemibagrus wyckioides]
MTGALLRAGCGGGTGGKARLRLSWDAERKLMKSAGTVQEINRVGVRVTRTRLELKSRCLLEEEEPEETPAPPTDATRKNNRR